MARGENDGNRTVFKVGHWYRAKKTFKRWESEFFEGELVAFMKYFYRFDHECHVYRFETPQDVVKYFVLLEADPLDLWQAFFDEVAEGDAPPIREPRPLPPVKHPLDPPPRPTAPPAKHWARSFRTLVVWVGMALLAVAVLVAISQGGRP